MGTELFIRDRADRAIADLKEQIPGLKLLEKEPMSGHCSFKVGGPVRGFVVPENTEELIKVFSVLKKDGIIPYLLGNGTNVVFPDEGCDGLIVVSTEKLQRISMPDEKHICAEAGVSLSRLAGFALEHSLTGLEFASGIPGTVGGGVMMNAGAYGGELKDTVESVSVYYLPDQIMCEMENEQCGFGYRKSFFQTKSGYVILHAVFSLKKGNRDDISAKMKELNAKRREKQPLDMPSAGSAFRRPEGYYAAALIEECGLKGYSIGGAQVSGKHAGFIVNTGNATAKDLADLISYVRDTVLEKKQVRMIPEVILIPENYSPENGKHAENTAEKG